MKLVTLSDGFQRGLSLIVMTMWNLCCIGSEPLNSRGFGGGGAGEGVALMSLFVHVVGHCGKKIA